MWSGRRPGKKGGDEGDSRDWNKYKKASKKKKLEEASKTSGNIQKMFKKQSEAATLKENNDDVNNNTYFAEAVSSDVTNDKPTNVEASTPQLSNANIDEAEISSTFNLSCPLPNPLPFFVNGCYAKDKTGSNFTCGPETPSSVLLRL